MDGGYAEYATLRTEAVVPIPEDMDPIETAPLLCAGITTFSTSLSLFRVTGLMSFLQILFETWTSNQAMLLLSKESEDSATLPFNSPKLWVSEQSLYRPPGLKKRWLTSSAQLTTSTDLRSTKSTHCRISEEPKSLSAQPQIRKSSRT